MSKLLIITQVYENYGEADSPYWKAKGGCDYVVKNIDPNRASEIATWAAGQIEQDNEMFTEHIIHWEVVADDYLTEFERSQLEYDGRIMFPAKEIVVDGIAV